MTSQLGKRYVCEVCGTEVLCTKGGAGALTCCDREMKIKGAKPLPSVNRQGVCPPIGVEN